MRIFMSFLLVTLLFAGQSVAEEKSQVELNTDTQKLSYALGLDLGAYFKTLGEDIDLTILQQGISDSYQGKKPLLSDDESAAIQQKFAQKQQEPSLPIQRFSRLRMMLGRKSTSPSQRWSQSIVALSSLERRRLIRPPSVPLALCWPTSNRASFY